MFGALTKNKVGFGHSNEYYAQFFHMSHTEAFAEATTILGHKNPFYGELMKKMVPDWEKFARETLESA